MNKNIHSLVNILFESNAALNYLDDLVRIDAINKKLFENLEKLYPDKTLTDKDIEDINNDKRKLSHIYR